MGMDNTAKRIVRTAGVVVGLGAAAWALRDRLLPAPQASDEPLPKFRDHAPDQVDIDEHAELITLHGIGPATADRLKQAGIMNVPMLAAADAVAIAEAVNTTEATATKWIETARAAE